MYDFTVFLAYVYIVIMSFILGRTIAGTCVRTVCDNSMEPTLPKWSRVFMMPLIFWPRRGDIVGIRRLYSKGWSIRRIIGVPGDIVELGRNHVYINGIELDEPYLENLDVFYRPFRWELKAGQYIVLADNRRERFDSRIYGPVYRKEIKCRMWWRINEESDGPTGYAPLKHQYTRPAAKI